MTDEGTWRGDLTDDQRCLLSRAESVMSEWNEGTVDCFRWIEFVVWLATRIDDTAFVHKKMREQVCQNTNLAYPGFQHVTFNEAHEFADRVLRQMGIDRQAMGWRDFDFLGPVSVAYNEIIREQKGLSG